MTLHVVVGHSAAGSLITGLRNAGWNDQVACFPDDLSFGPIAPPHPAVRTDWIGQHLDIDWEEVAALVEARFWNPVLSWSARRVLWLSRRSAREYTGFLEIVHRLGDQPCDVIDITEADIMCRPRIAPDAEYRANAVALLQPEAFLEAKTLERLATLTAATRKEHHQLWHQLRTENAPLRVIADSRLASAPLDYFDQILLSLVAAEWQKLARILGNALRRIGTEGDPHVNDLVLEARLRALVQAGRVEGRGMDQAMHDAELRLPIADL